MLIYSKISTLMSIILAVSNDLDIAAPRSSLNLIVLHLSHMCVDSNVMKMCDLEPDILPNIVDCNTMETAILDLCK